MTQPLDTVTKFFRVLDAAGAAVAGLVLADFTFVAYVRPYGGADTAWAHSSTITQPVSGFYAWTMTKHSAAGHDGILILPVVTTRTIEFVSVSGEVETQDLDSLYGSVSRPVVTLSGQGTVGQTVPLVLVSKRYRKVRFTFVDDLGAQIDMTVDTTYTAYKWSVRATLDQTLAPPKYDQTTGITAGLGFVEVTILEASTFFNALLEGATVADTYEGRHELSADLVAVASETVALVPSSTLTMTRREHGT